MRFGYWTLLRHTWPLALGAAFLVSAFTSPPSAFAQQAPLPSLDDAAAAVVRIEAVGTFVDPYEGTQPNVPGFGSGFLIDASGLAVTNNHVVTGGALFRVYVPGRDEPVNARVLGVSECSDLAVIDLTGEGYPFLAWEQGDLAREAAVFAAGYPMGDPDFVLTEGAVTDFAASGESDWSSLETVIAHNARIQPGNSGGPLLDGAGRVVGVNYAGSTAPRRSYAIPATAALEILDALAAGRDVDALGINGMALDESGRSGVWVASVESGSQADRAGLLPGDLLFAIEGAAVAVNGTMEEYCDIIRSHDATDVLQFKVYRESTQEVLVGQFNGEPVSVSTDEPYPPLAADDGFAYVPLADSSGVIAFDVPEAWSAIEERDWVLEGQVVGRQLIVATDLQDFLRDRSAPGMAVSWSFTLDEKTTPRTLSRTPDLSDACDYASSEEDADPGVYAAYERFYAGCEQETVALVDSYEDQLDSYILKAEFYGISDPAMDVYSRFYQSLSIDAAAYIPVDPAEYVTVRDETGRIAIRVPPLWVDTRSEALDEDGDLLGRLLTVAPNVDEYNDFWGTPGVTVNVYDDIGLQAGDLEGWLADYGEIEDCTFDGRFAWQGAGYAGLFNRWRNCAGEEDSYYLDY
ncbi:MAG: S1C family serine protease, partial [Caldilineaceae bacterium]